MKRSRGWVLVILLLAAAGFSACAPASSIDTDSSTPAVSSTPTATIDWFPATATPTSRPTQTAQPTADQRPGVSDEILQDDFTDTTRWQTSKLSTGSVAYSNGKLTLAVSTPHEKLYSFRNQTELTDFYLEITANASLCRQKDSFGVLFRVKTPNTFYRLLFNCDAQMRFERVSGGEPIALVNWMTPARAQVGPMQDINIGLWVKGSSIRVFINDVYQFEVKDASFPTGGLGVYALSNGDTPLTVNFKDLNIWALEGGATPAPSATALPVKLTNTPTPIH
jgi:hypothetical protein